MGVDYERLAFWDELVSSSPSELRVSDWLDRVRLKAALVALDLDLPIGFAVDDIVEGVADRIFQEWFEYVRHRREPRRGPSNELRSLQKALSKWLGKHGTDQDPEGYVLHHRDTFVQFFEMIEGLIGVLQLQPKGKQERAETTFLRRLYELYVDLSGKTELSSQGYGPADRFIRECAGLVGIHAPPEIRQLIRQSIARARNGAKMDLE